MSALFLRCVCNRRIKVRVEDAGRVGTCLCGEPIPVPQADAFAKPNGRERSVRATGLWRSGELVDGRYEVVGKVGEGTFGSVWRVRHRDWKLDLAVKELRPDRKASEQRLRNFERECQAWIDLGMHPNVVTAWYVRELSGTPYLFLEYCDGGSLHDWIEQEKTRSPDTALDIGIQLCWGLAHCHTKGIVHRDFKPLNVLMTSDGQARLTDFGAVKFAALDVGEDTDTLTDPRRTIGGRWQGTPPYMPPEQWKTNGPLDHRADLYALGVTLFEMLTGDWPVKSTRAGVAGWIAAHSREQPLSLKSIRPDVPEALLDLLAHCLARQPEDRPMDAARVANELISIHEELTRKEYPRTEPVPARAQAMTLNNKGVSLFDLGQVAQAEAAWREAIQIDPQHPEATFNLAQVQWRSGRLNDIDLIRRLQQMVASNRDSWHPKALLAQTHLDRGDATSARSALLNTPAEQREIQALHERAEILRFGIGRPRLTFTQHDNEVRSLALSPDGRLALSGSAEGRLLLWAVDKATTERGFFGHEDAITAACFDPSGRRVLSASADLTVRLWDATDGRCLRTLDGDGEVVSAACFHPDGTRFLTAGWDRAIRLWSVGGKCLLTLLGHADAVTTLACTPDGGRVVSGSQDRTLKVWDLERGECLHTLEGHTQVVTGVSVTPDGRLAVSCSNDRTLKVWDLASGRCLRTMVGHAERVLAVCLGPNGRRALSGSLDGQLRLWDVTSGLWLQSLPGHKKAVLAVAFHPDGDKVLSAGRDRTVCIWQDDHGMHRPPLALCRTRPSRAILDAQAAHARALAQGKRALEAEDWLTAVNRLTEARKQPGFERHRETLDVWAELYSRQDRVGFRDGWSIATLAGHQGEVTDLGFHPDGRLAFSTGKDHVLRLWEIPSGELLQQWGGSTRGYLAACFSPDGRFLLADDGTRFVAHEVETGKTVLSPNRAYHFPRTIAISPDPRFLFVQGAGATWWLLSRDATRAWRKYAPGEISESNACLSPDGRFLLQVPKDGSMSLYVFATGELAHARGSRSSKARLACWGADRRTVLLGDSTGELQVWDFDDATIQPPFRGMPDVWHDLQWESKKHLSGHPVEINALAMSPDSRFALSGSADTTLKLWDIERESCVRTFQGHTRAVNALSFSPDARYALSGGADGVCLLWFLDWDLGKHDLTDWDERARPWLETFLALQTPCQEEARIEEPGALGRLWRHLSGTTTSPPEEEEIQRILARRGKATWSVEEFQRLMQTLGRAGFGWLRPEGVHRELLAMTKG